jgi:DNA-binding protein H-NS
MSTKTYQQLQQEIANLQHQAEQLRQQEIMAVVSDIKAKMAEYDLSLSDLSDGVRAKSVKGAGRSAVAAKFRDPASGQTWSGRGRSPKWLGAYEAAGRKRDEFAVG